MAENQHDTRLVASPALRTALAGAALGVVPAVRLAAAMARVDGQAKAMRDALDDARLYHSGVVGR